MKPLRSKGIKEMKKEWAEANSYAEAVVKRAGGKIDVPTGKLLFHEDEINLRTEKVKEMIKGMDIPKGKNLILEVIDQAYKI